VETNHVNVRLILEPPSCLSAYATVPIAFEVSERLDLKSPHHARPVEPSYVKDYDRIAGNHPKEWPARFDVSRWCILAAHVEDVRVGGAVLVPNGSEVEPATASDLALL